MHKSTLSVAIAGALAVPMAAQAVDVELSGRVSRALFINDSETSTGAEVQDNGSSGSRIRVKGTGEMMDGGSAGVLLEYSAGSALGLRYADIWFSGGYGKVSIGQGDQGGEGSVYKGGAAVIGTGHGQDHNEVAKGYYTSLDGGAGRNERLRYDSPAVGPVSAAISVGNGDQVSAGISLSQEFGGTSFSAGIGSIQWGDGSDKSTISGSAGVTLASGISISGAWGRGTNYVGGTDPGSAAVAAVAPLYKDVDAASFDAEAVALQDLIDAGNAPGANAAAVTDGKGAAEDLDALFDTHSCYPVTPADEIGNGDTLDLNCQPRLRMHGTAAIQAVDPMTHVTDPSFVQVAASYALGDTSVGVSWYRSSDMQREGSELTAVGIGVDHSLPKLRTNVYAAVQNYSIEDAGANRDSDDSVVMIGAIVKF